MLCIKFVRDYGAYHIGDEVRLEKESAQPLINGGYAEMLGEVKMESSAPENKSAPKKESILKKALKSVEKRKKASNEE